ncbi:MAG: hypothetical protein HUN05_20785 [Desulfobacter sp.]|nr:MAG: hypothetical protein HUN05_20785 [Desulfobacter sp.]
MEKIADDMSGLLNETLGFYKELKVLLEAEKKYITDMDVQKLWDSTDRKKQIVESIESMIARILDRVKTYVSDFEMDVRSFRVREVVAVLPLKMRIKSGLKTIGLKIDGLKHEIGLMANENKRYILEYLSVIDGVFSTIKQRPDQDQYSSYGHILSSNETTRLINAEV